jgi:hypothetical protein
MFAAEVAASRRIDTTFDALRSIHLPMKQM